MMSLALTQRAGCDETMRRPRATAAATVVVSTTDEEMDTCATARRRWVTCAARADQGRPTERCRTLYTNLHRCVRWAAGDHGHPGLTCAEAADQ